MGWRALMSRKYKIWHKCSFWHAILEFNRNHFLGHFERAFCPLFALKRNVFSKRPKKVVPINF